MPRKPNEDPKVLFSIYVEESVVRQLRQIAKKEKVSTQEIIRRALREYIERYKTEKAIKIKAPVKIIIKAKKLQPMLKEAKK